MPSPSKTARLPVHRKEKPLCAKSIFCSGKLNSLRDLLHMINYYTTENSIPQGVFHFSGIKNQATKVFLFAALFPPA